MIPMLDDVTFTEERMIITHITLELGTAGIAKVLKIARMLKYKEEFDYLFQIKRKPDIKCVETYSFHEFGKFINRCFKQIFIKPTRENMIFKILFTLLH